MPLTSLSNAQILKEETAVQHQKAEDLIIPLLENLRTVSQYQALLRMYLGFYEPMQNSIHFWITPAILPDIEERDHARLLRTDLGPALDTFSNIPAPQFKNKEEALGALYVLEGSTLGGQVISRMLSKNGAISHQSFNFFNSYGPLTGQRWKKFIEVINNQKDVSSVVKGAASAFEVFISHIQSIVYEPLEQDQ